MYESFSLFPKTLQPTSMIISMKQFIIINSLNFNILISGSEIETDNGYDLGVLVMKKTLLIVSILASLLSVSYTHLRAHET